MFRQRIVSGPAMLWVNRSVNAGLGMITCVNSHMDRQEVWFPSHVTGFPFFEVIGSRINDLCGSYIVVVLSMHVCNWCLKVERSDLNTRERRVCNLFSCMKNNY